ncbi:MAG: helix-turn-helix domain-containing protein [Candidatus Omnitrophica bacterium]|nr:helix-turn-helix domain-containing protein [Candidatus Omnitrophota bacterium]
MERFISIKEASEFLGVKEMTLYSWRHKGLVPCYKLRGKLLFRQSELNSFVESCKEPMLVA